MRDFITYDQLTEEDKAIARRLKVKSYSTCYVDSINMATLVERRTLPNTVRAGFGMTAVQFERFCREVYGV